MIGIGLGVASAGFGIYNQMEGAEEAEEGRRLQQQGAQLQAEGARQLHELSVEQSGVSKQYAARERDLNIQAADQSVAAAAASRDINRNIVGYERQAEAQRFQAMELDARRKQTEMIRNQQRARSLALSSATAQGSSRGSGLQGGYAQISGQTGFNLMGVQQNLEIGRNIFNINSAITDQKLAFADLEFNYAQQRAAQQTAKSNLMYDYALTNADFTTRQSAIQTQYNVQGQSLINMGAGQVSAGQSQMSLGSSFLGAATGLASMGNMLGTVGPSLWGSSPSTVYGAAGSYGVPTYT